MRSDFESLLSSPNAAQVLKVNSSDKASVKQLQQALFAVGFGPELNWTDAGADGAYGSSTANAVKAFAAKNGLKTDGTSISEEVGKALVDKYEVARSLRALNDTLQQNDEASALIRGSDDASTVESLQKILNKMGFSKELNWEKYGADGDYGGSTTAAVKALAAKEGMSSDGSKVGKEMVQKILAKFTPFLGDKWASGHSNPNARLALPPEIKFHSKDNGQGKKVYDAGRLSAKNYIENNPGTLKDIGMTESTLKVISAVSQNEGKLEAINTYDNSFMTFGMFQWTIGAKGDKGELAALLKKIKEQDDSVFYTYFGQYGLDVHERKTNSTYGYLTLNGRLLNRPKRKERLRTAEWGAKFWKSGHDPLVQAIEIEHAANRLKTFYWKEAFKANGFLLSELITSEYGVALLLDNHVNRPGYVKKCVAEAMTKTGLSNPSSWTTAQEHQLIDAYLTIRETYGKYPMTHAKQRGDLIKGLVSSGKMSGERGSFAFGPEIGSRSIFDDEPVAPMNLDDESYEIIDGSMMDYQE